MAYYATARIFADPFGAFLQGFRQAQADRRQELALLDQFRRTQLLASGDRRAWEQLFLNEDYRRDVFEFDKEKFKTSTEFQREKFDFDKQYRQEELKLKRDEFNLKKQASTVDPAAIAAEVYSRTTKSGSGASETTVEPPTVRSIDTNLPSNASAPTGVKKYTDRLPGLPAATSGLTRQPKPVQDRIVPPAVPSGAAPAQLPSLPSSGATLEERARAKQAMDAYMAGKQAQQLFAPPTPVPQQQAQQRLATSPVLQQVEAGLQPPAEPQPPAQAPVPNPLASAITRQDAALAGKTQERIIPNDNRPAPVAPPQTGGAPLQRLPGSRKYINDRIPPPNVERAINLISTISQRLSDPNLTPQARQQLRQALRKAQEIVRRFNQGG